MPDFAEWGPAANGARLQQLNAQKMQMSEIAMQKEKAEIDNTQAQTQERLQKVSMEKQKQQQDQQKQAAMQDIAMRQRGQSLESHGQALIDAGYLTEGTKILEEASQIIERQATTAYKQAETEEKQLASKAKMFDLLGRVTDSIQTPEQWESAKARIQQALGKPLPKEIADATWSPQFKKQLSDFAVSKKDQIELALKQKDFESKAALRGEEIRVSKARQGLIAAQTKVESEKVAKTTKAVGAPRTPKEDITTAMGIIKAENPGANPEDPLMVTEGTFIASEAQMLLKKNPALDRSTAIQQAYNNAKARGDITTAKHQNSLMEFGKKPDDVTFKPGNKAQAQAPAAAVAYLKAHPEQKEAFKKKYGYLPGDE